MNLYKTCIKISISYVAVIKHSNSVLFSEKKTAKQCPALIENATRVCEHIANYAPPDGSYTGCELAVNDDCIL